MRRTRPFEALLRTALLACLAGTAPLWALEQEAQSRPPQMSGQEEQAYWWYIQTIESRYGAYAPQLSEQLLGLGKALQAQSRHQEALDLFKRGVHLARINEGLYSQEQIPLLQGQISSHLALGQYAIADERQRYMYRVQVRSMQSGQPRALAFMQQANWQYNAYQMQLGDMGYSRLMNMWDLYRMALNDLIAREGESSEQLLLPLRGMLQAQYLISSYDPQSDAASNDSPDGIGDRQQLNRFYSYRSQSYDKGSAVIKAMRDIALANDGPQSVEVAQYLVMLGDWQLWNEQREESTLSYQGAIRELAGRDDAQIQIDQLLGEPVALPNMDGVRPLPPQAGTEEADILLEFGISPKGQVVDLERVDENEATKGKGNRLMRRLRKTRFRPRFEAGEPVGTEQIVRAYNIE